MTNIFKNIRYLYISKGDFRNSETKEEGVWKNSKGLFIKIKSKSLLLTNIKVQDIFEYKYEQLSKEHYKGYTIFRFGEEYEMRVHPLEIAEYLVIITEYIENNIKKVII